MTTTIVIGLILGALWAFVGQSMAKKRGRSPLVWGIVCFVFGLIGLAVLAIFGRTPEVKQAETQIAVAAAQAKPQVSRTEELAQLATLHDSGALTDDEFAHEKDRVLVAH